MIKSFHARTADELWLTLRSEFLNPCSYSVVESRNGPAREIIHSVFSLSEPRQRWVLSRTPAMNPAFALTEVIWILAGRDDAAFLNFFNRSLPKYAGHAATFHGAYGYRLRRHFGNDQLEAAFQALSHNPTSRQVVLQIWDGRSDFPDPRGNPVDPDIPCNIISLLKIRDQQLHWTQVVRSNDLFRGLPYNLVQFTTLQEIIAGWLGVSVGPYQQISDSLHLYDSDVESISEVRPAISIENSDSFAFKKDECENWVRIISKSIETCISKSLTRTGLETIVNNIDAPKAFRNLFLVVCAEVARRRKWHKFPEAVMSECSNQAYIQLWDQWINRLARDGADNDLCRN